MRNGAYKEEHVMEYDKSPAPIGWVERLDRRFMEHQRNENEQWHRLHEEIAILRTKMEAAEQERKETQILLKSLNDQMAELRGQKQAMYAIMTLIGIFASAVSATITWLSFK